MIFGMLLVNTIGIFSGLVVIIGLGGLNLVGFVVISNSGRLLLIFCLLYISVRNNDILFVIVFLLFFLLVVIL